MLLLIRAQSLVMAPTPKAVVSPLPLLIMPLFGNPLCNVIAVLEFMTFATINTSTCIMI